MNMIPTIASAIIATVALTLILVALLLFIKTKLTPSGKVKINTVYNGLEFDPVTKKFVDQDAKNHRNKK